MAVYDDGHGFCFSCNTHYPAEEVGEKPAPSEHGFKAQGVRLGTEYKPLLSRDITEDTCRHFRYSVGDYSKDRRAQFAPYYDKEGRLVAAKVRFPGKDFKVIGSLDKALPFGAHAFDKTGKMITITEGEIDAMSMSQCQGNTFPVVSVGNGAAGAKKFIAKNLEYFNGFERINIMFDKDEAGQKAAEEVADLFGTRAHIASLPGSFKDPNDMLKAGQVKELINAMWRAKKHVPSGIVDILDTDLRERACRKIEEGLSWPWPSVTKLTYGIRTGEIYTFGAGTGAGKTNLLLQFASHMIEEHHEGVGLFFLEQAPTETSLRLAGHLSKQILHTGAETEQIGSAWDYMESLKPKVFMYDSFGFNEWETIEDRIRFLFHAEEIKYFVVDHITAMATADDDERKQLDNLMRNMGSLVKELDITLFVVSHLATPLNGSHEEGAPVKLREFRGSRAIGMWTHYAVGIERNQVAESPEERCRTRFKFLKDRFAGTAAGEVVLMDYDTRTGQLIEAGTENPFGEEGEGEASSF
jgi:twinkle protein